MATTTSSFDPRDHGFGLYEGYPEVIQPTASAVSWGAIIAGAAASAALSLILLILGVGLGLSSVSPWWNEGISATTFGISTIVWLAVTQLLASGLGGYLAGRLRTKWAGAHTDEVYFRDTAHGFLSWALAMLVSAALLTSAIASILAGGVQAGASVAGAVANAATIAGSAAAASGSGNSGISGNPGDGGIYAYFIDTLFRPTEGTDAATAPADGAGRFPGREATEIGRIFMNAGRSETLPPEDLRYVAQRVAQRAGISQADAEKRVTETYTRLRTKLKAADTMTRDATERARKASAYAALWIFVSLLCGAFVASLFATYGGRRRDA